MLFVTPCIKIRRFKGATDHNGSFVYVLICEKKITAWSGREKRKTFSIDGLLAKPSRKMLYLKIIFLTSYFLIIFLFFRTIELYVSSINSEVALGIALGSWTFIKSYFIDEYNFQEPTERRNENLDLLRTVQRKTENDDEISETAVDIKFLGYEDYIEKVEDTKASVWVVEVFPITKSSLKMNSDSWSVLSAKFKNNGIKTGSYFCHKDIRLCLIHRITSPTLLLSMPKGSQPKGNIAFHSFGINKNNTNTLEDVAFKWVQAKLFPRIKTVHSMSELTEPPVSRLKLKDKIKPSINFIYESNGQTPPLLLTALSVRFTGRIKFFMLKSNLDNSNGERIIAMNKFSKYSYGDHKGENFTYSCMELFLKTLHPEVNDIFIASIILLNMACWLEVSLQKGGPLRRLLFYAWGFMTSNILLFSVWVPLIQIIYMPQVQPIVEIFLKNLQKMMFTNVAAVIRQDFLQLSKHLHIVFAGFVCYGIFLGYLHFKLRSEESDNSFLAIFEHDIEDIRTIFRSFLEYITPTLRIYRFEARIERILQHLSTSDLWLPTDSCTEYIKHLPNWKHCTKQYEKPVDVISDSEFFSESEYSEECSDQSSLDDGCGKKCPSVAIPSHIFPVHDCVICLEKYKCKQTLLGLPCGHSFHKNCVVGWLVSDSAQNRCPVCRWPCNVRKGKLELVDLIE